LVKLRVEQALAGESDSVVLYRLSALFMFYAEKITPQIGADSELARTVEELNQLTLNIFYSGLTGAVQKILSKMGAPDYDLLPVPAVHQVLMLLRDVLDTHDGAMAPRQNAAEE
uniref:Conserved oligomeric Golgi complex subunit 6 n=1 Tax=Haemonchus placei TaxID=6290 RepID=A0A0N4VXX2_HAEPC